MITANSNSVQKDSQDQPRSVRLVFRYKNDRIDLVSAQTVQMMPCPSDALVARKKESGFWYELKDGRNKTIFRRVTQNPIRHFVELRSENPDRPFTWQKVENPSGTFVLVVPEMSKARHVSIFSSPPGAESLKPAREIARFDLRKPKKGKER